MGLVEEEVYGLTGLPRNISLVVVSQAAAVKYVTLGSFKQQKFIFRQCWRLAACSQGVGRRGHTLPKALRGDNLPVSFQWLWRPLACGCVAPVPACIFTWPCFLDCRVASPFLSLVRMPIVGFRATLSDPGSSHLKILNFLHSKLSHILRFQVKASFFSSGGGVI